MFFDHFSQGVSHFFFVYNYEAVACDVVIFRLVKHVDSFYRLYWLCCLVKVFLSHHFSGSSRSIIISFNSFDKLATSKHRICKQYSEKISCPYSDSLSVVSLGLAVKKMYSFHKNVFSYLKGSASKMTKFMLKVFSLVSFCCCMIIYKVNKKNTRI